MNSTTPDVQSDSSAPGMTTSELVMDNDGESGYTTSQMYGFGTAAVAIIGTLSILGILLFPTLKSRSHGHIVQFFIAFGAGTMTSDALLHMIPEVLGGQLKSDVNTWKMSVACGGIFAFFLFENSLKVWTMHRSMTSPAQSEIPDASHETRDDQLQNTIKVTSFSSIPSVSTEQHESDRAQDDSQTEDSLQTYVTSRTKFCWKFNTTLFTLFIGDILHNFADGIAIGVSFSSSAANGIGTSIVVFCHEVPHEFGDFVIHLKNGATKWQALGLNVIASLTAFIGLYAGIALSQDEVVRQWLLAVISGMFLYIALVQVVVELEHHATASPILQFSLQITGLLLGWTLMLILGIYQEDITASIS